MEGDVGARGGKSRLAKLIKIMKLKPKALLDCSSSNLSELNAIMLFCRCLKFVPITCGTFMTSINV